MFKSGLSFTPQNALQPSAVGLEAMTSKYGKRSEIDVPTWIQFYDQSTSGRSLVETFVSQVFLTAHRARIEHFLPTLMALGNAAGRVSAALGLRPAASGRLFLERYLDEPVEKVLAASAASRIARDDLVEVGNFAVGVAGGGRWLITALTAYLQATERSWAVFTCGPVLQNAFHRLGIDLIDLGSADPGRLTPEELRQWGSYYESGPRVKAANVSQSHAALSLQLEKECALSLLWLGAFQAGRLAA